MSKPVMIEVALNGVTSPRRNPHVPATVEAQAADALACIDAGGTIIHTHAPDLFVAADAAAAQYAAAFRPAVERHPGVVCYPTVGFGPTMEDSYRHVELLREMKLARQGALDTGSVNLGGTGPDGLAPPSDFVYLPYRQTKPRQMVLLARSIGDAAALAAPLREVVRGLDPNLPIFNVRTMEDLYRMRAVSVFNVLVTIVAGMGAMGLGLAIVGLYGLVAYAASRRTREIGIRLAIGAERGTVLRLVLRQGLGLALTGLVVGLVASVGAGRLLIAAFPSGDNQRDLTTLFLVVPIVLAVTFVASYIPALQASRINPINALRQE